MAEQTCAARGWFELGSQAPLCRGKEWGWRREPRQRLRPCAVPGAAGAGGSLPTVLGAGGKAEQGP